MNDEIVQKIAHQLLSSEFKDAIIAEQNIAFADYYTDHVSIPAFVGAWSGLVRWSGSAEKIPRNPCEEPVCEVIFQYDCGSTLETELDPKYPPQFLTVTAATASRFCRCRAGLSQAAYENLQEAIDRANLRLAGTHSEDGEKSG